MENIKLTAKELVELLSQHMSVMELYSNTFTVPTNFIASEKVQKRHEENLRLVEEDLKKIETLPKHPNKEIADRYDELSDRFHKQIKEYREWHNEWLDSIGIGRFKVLVHEEDYHTKIQYVIYYFVKHNIYLKLTLNKQDEISYQAPDWHNVIEVVQQERVITSYIEKK